MTDETLWELFLHHRSLMIGKNAMCNTFQMRHWCQYHSSVMHRPWLSDCSVQICRKVNQLRYNIWGKGFLRTIDGSWVDFLYHISFLCNIFPFECSYISRWYGTITLGSFTVWLYIKIIVTHDCLELLALTNLVWFNFMHVFCLYIFVYIYWQNVFRVPWFGYWLAAFMTSWEIKICHCLLFANIDII